jgi:hypothetical protein
MTDYAEYLINAQKLLRAIEEETSRRNYKKAFELAYHLGELTDMLKFSLLQSDKK